MAAECGGTGLEISRTVLQARQGGLGLAALRGHPLQLAARGAQDALRRGDPGGGVGVLGLRGRGLADKTAGALASLANGGIDLAEVGTRLTDLSRLLARLAGGFLVVGLRRRRLPC